MIDMDYFPQTKSIVGMYGPLSSASLLNAAAVWRRKVEIGVDLSSVAFGKAGLTLTLIGGICLS
jgi:hypothetical protein